MKVVTLISTVALDKSGKSVTTPPGVVDLDEETAKDLVARGFAKTIEKAKADDKAKADASKGAVKIEGQGDGPKVEGQ